MPAARKPKAPAKAVDDLKQASRDNRKHREEEEHHPRFEVHPGKKSASPADIKRSGGMKDGAVQEPLPPFGPQKKQPPPGLEARMNPKPNFYGAAYHPANKLEGKVALITGGDSGIGRAVATFYAREGADIAIIYLAQEQQDAELVREVARGEGRRCLLIPGDVTSSEFCREAVERTVRELGRLDILVNNAAYQQHHEKIEDLSEEQWEHTFRTNIFGYFYMAKAALKHMQRGGAIINTGSETGLEGNKQLLDYSATKGAIHAFTKSLSQMLESDSRKIRVNCVAPGPIWTPLQVQDKDPEEARKHGADTPMGRGGQPEELAPAYVFLASNPDSSYISGEILRVLGGLTMAG